MYLIVNCGSSSIKVKLYKVELANIELIFEKSISDINFKGRNGFKNACAGIWAELIKFDHKIHTTAYRVVFGGKNSKDGEIATDKAIKKILKNSSIAPLHNKNAVTTIKYFRNKIKCQHLLYYDTSYFEGINHLLPINQKIAKKYGIARHGFHGISHKYAVENSGVNKYQKVISIHIGAGVSVSAINNGKPIMNSMGMTPYGGVCMINRSGDLDPGILLFLIEKIGYKRTKKIISSSSGIVGILNIEANFLDILNMSGEKIEDERYMPSKTIKSNTPSQNAKTALEYFCNDVKQYIGKYSALMGGVEAIVFTGKVGAGSKVIRDKICYGLDYLKLKEVVYIKTDEEMAILKSILDIKNKDKNVK